jgi:hypothetical protein
MRETPVQLNKAILDVKNSGILKEGLEKAGLKVTETRNQLRFYGTWEEDSQYMSGAIKNGVIESEQAIETGKFKRAYAAAVIARKAKENHFSGVKGKEPNTYHLKKGPDDIKVTIMPDGTIKTETGKVSGPNHSTAEKLLLDIQKAAGGKTKQLSMGHKHHHKHSHQHTHTHDGGHQH